MEFVEADQRLKAGDQGGARGEEESDSTRSCLIGGSQEWIEIEGGARSPAQATRIGARMNELDESNRTHSSGH